MITCEGIQTQTHHPCSLQHGHGCPAGAKPSSEAETAHSVTMSLCPSMTPGDGNVTQNQSLPCSLLAAGEVSLPHA